MVISLKTTATLPHADAPKPGRHHLDGFVFPGFGRIGVNPNQVSVKSILSRNDRDMKPVTRRAAR
jgi:hypothetical protein